MGASLDEHAAKVAWEPREEPLLQRSRPRKTKSAAFAELRWYRGKLRPEMFLGWSFLFEIEESVQFGVCSVQLRSRSDNFQVHTAKIT